MIVGPDTYEPQQLETLPSVQAALDGTYVSDTFLVNTDNTPAVKKAEAELKDIGQPPVLTNGVAIGYWTGDFFVQALNYVASKVGAAKVTQQAFHKYKDLQRVHVPQLVPWRHWNGDVPARVHLPDAVRDNA
jgi:hypothetical protein